MLTLRSVARRQTCGVDGGRDQSTVTVYSLPYCTRQEARLDQTPTERERERDHQHPVLLRKTNAANCKFKGQETKQGGRR